MRRPHQAWSPAVYLYAYGCVETARVIVFNCDEAWRFMKRTLMLPVTDEELVELCRILLDRDQEGALQFLEEHLRGKVNQVLEGG